MKVVGIVDSPKNNKVTISVESSQGPINCRQSGKPTKPLGYGRTVTLRHLSLLGKETYIEITPRRGRCDNCDEGMTTNETFDWYDPRSKMTKIYKQYLLFQLNNSTVADVRRKRGD
jgi:transposase